MTVSPTFIIVGAGYGGLATAIELAKKNVKATVYESVKALTNQGDVIMISSNATRVMSKWGDVLAKAVALAATPGSMIVKDKSGKDLLEQPLPAESFGFPNVIAHRGETQRLMYEYAKSLGVEIHLNSRVTEYFEDDQGPGVVVNGKRIRASGVIATDGIHSKGKAYIIGRAQHAPSSGFAVYRSWFPLQRLAKNPLTKHIADSKVDQWFVWIGEDVHAIVTTNVSLQRAVCFCTHKDTYVTEESWSFPGRVEDMLKVVDGWDPVIQEVIKQIPSEALIDWKLLWRDPGKKWVSDKGGVVLAGDSAHPHLATSGSGAAQAIEDAATLGSILERLGSKDIPLAFKVFTKLRFERTSLTQRMGWETRHRWHQTDWEVIAKNPEFLKMPQPAWLYAHDAEQYAIDNLDAAIASIKDGVEFRNTNTPQDYVHEDWTVESMMEAEKTASNGSMYKVSNE